MATGRCAKQAQHADSRRREAPAPAASGPGIRCIPNTGLAPRRRSIIGIRLILKDRDTVAALPLNATSLGTPLPIAGIVRFCFLLLKYVCYGKLTRNTLAERPRA